MKRRGLHWLRVCRARTVGIPMVCASLLLASASVHGQDLDNLARGRSFTTSGTTYGNWTGLVDGVTDSDRAPHCFATDGSDRFPKWVVIDLGFVCRISKVEVFNSYNGNVKTVEIYWSRHGQKFDILREYIFPNGRLEKLSHSFPPREARYVKVAFRDTHGDGYGGDYYMFLREVEVWGEPGSAGTPTSVTPEHRLDAGPRWLKIFRHYALRGDADLKLMLLGDSVGVPPPSADDVRPFGQLLAELLTEQALGGDEAGEGAQVRLTDLCADRHGLATCLARLDQEVITQEPDIVVVAFGQWASLQGDRTGLRDRLNRLVAGLLDGTHAAVILVTPPPMLGDETKPFYEDTRGRSCTWAEQTVKAIGELNDLPVLDTAAALKETELDLAELYEDNLHLNAIGHTVVAQRIFNLLR